MKPVREIHRVSDALVVWQGYNPAVKVDCSSTAVRGEAGWIAIDPIPLETAALHEFTGGGRLNAIVLTSGNHQRAALDFQQAHGGEIYAPRLAQAELTADHWFDDGALVANRLRAIGLPGVALGETALLADDILIVGDALIHLEELTILPEKYCEDGKQLKASLRQLLALDFQTVCFAHGLPLRQRAKEKVAALVDQN